MDCFLFKDCYGPGPLWIVEHSADMDLLAYFYDPGSLADTTSAYCTEIPDLERNLSTVILGSSWSGFFSSTLWTFWIELILLWGIAMDVCPYGIEAIFLGCVTGKGSYYS